MSHVFIEVIVSGHFVSQICTVVVGWRCGQLLRVELDVKLGAHVLLGPVETVLTRRDVVFFVELDRLEALLVILKPHFVRHHLFRVFGTAKRAMNGIRHGLGTTLHQRLHALARSLLGPLPRIFLDIVVGRGKSSGELGNHTVL